MLSQFATIDEVREAIEGVKVVSLDKPGKSSTVHWRIGDAKGNQMVLEFVGGVPYFYENKVGDSSVENTYHHRQFNTTVPKVIEPQCNSNI